MKLEKGRKWTLSKRKHPMPCVLQAVSLTPDHFPQQPPRSALWGQSCFRCILCPSGQTSPFVPIKNRDYIKQKPYHLEVPYLHKMWSLYFLIPSRGLKDSEVSADAATVVFKCRLPPVSYLVSSCLMLPMLILLAWGLGMVIKGLFFGCKNVRRYALNRADWQGEFLVYMRFWHLEVYFSSNS